MCGKQVFSKKIQNQNHIELSLDKLVKGIYLIKVQLLKHIEIKRLIVDY